MYPRILEGSNVSKEEDLAVSKDVGRLKCILGGGLGVSEDWEGTMYL